MDWLKTQTLRLYLEGLSQEQIAIELDISEGTVSGCLQELRKLNDTLIFQHEVAVVSKKYGIPIQQLASELAYSNVIKKMSFDRNKMDSMLRVLNNVFLEDGSFTPDKAAKSVLHICNFMEANEIGLDEIDSKVDEKSIELREIKNEIVESKKITAKTKQNERAALRSSRLTRSKLRRFNKYRIACESVGVDFNNYVVLKNVLSVIQKMDGDPDRIINEMKKISDLEFRKFQLENNCDELERNLEIYQKEDENRRLYSGSFSAAMQLVTEAIGSVGTVEEIASLFRTIAKNKDNFSLSEFTKDIDTYGGIKGAIFKIKRELGKLTAERDNLLDSAGSNSSRVKKTENELNWC